MLTVERYGDVTRLRFSSRRSRLLGYDASAYVVRGVLVDTGFPAVRRDLAAWLDAERPAGVILTHHHEDHAGNIELVASRGIPIRAAEGTLRAMRAPKRIGIYRRFCWGSPPPLRSDAMPFDAAGLAFLATPGHSPDHHVVWDAQRRTLLAGDLFLGVKVRAAQPGENVPDLARSLRAAIALEPERVFCAHRGLLSDPIAMLRAKLEWLEWLIGAAAERRDAGLSETRIARELLGREGKLPIMTAGDLSKVNLIRATIDASR